MTDGDVRLLLTRRDFIKGAAGTAGLFAVGSLLEGCGPVKPAGPVTLTVWGLTEHVDKIKAEQELFEQAHPNIKLLFNTVDMQTVRDISLTLWASDDAPDVAHMWVDARIYPYLVEGNLLLPLDDLYESEGWEKVLDPVIVDFYTSPDGHRYSVNWNIVWAPVIYYNIAAFEEAGIAPPQMPNPYPADLEEWYGWCEALRSAGYEPLSVGGKEAWRLKHTHDHLLSHNTSAEQFEALISNWKPGSSEEYKYTDPEVVAVHQEIVDWVNKGIFAEGFMARDEVEGRALFSTGKAAMFQGGSWDAGPGILYKEVPKDMPFGWLLYPSMRAGEAPKVTLYFGDGLIISAKTKHPDEVKELVKFLMTKEAHERMARGGAWFPSRKDVPEEVVQALGEHVYGLWKATPILGATKLWGDLVPPQIGELCGRLLQEECAGTKTPEEACAEIEAVYEQLRAGG